MFKTQNCSYIRFKLIRKENVYLKKRRNCELRRRISSKRKLRQANISVFELHIREITYVKKKVYFVY